MANYISKITLPSGTTYDIKDVEARNAISSLTGISFSVAWKGNSAPNVANIPEGVVVTYNGTTYTGTKTAASATAGTFYLVYSSTQKDGTDIYDECVVITDGSTKKWEKIGDTGARFSDIVLKKQTTNALTGVSGSVSKQPTFAANSPTIDKVLGVDTTFTASKPNVTVTNTSTYLGVSLSGGSVTSSSTDFVTGFENPTTKNALGTGATFTTTVTPTTTNIKATASNSSVAWNNKDQKTVLTGVKVTAQPSITLSSSSETSTDAIAYLDGGSVSISTNAAVGANGTATVVTGYASPTKDDVLGVDASFLTTVTPSTTKITATASGAKYGSPSSDTFVKSYPGASGNLVTTTITGVSGSTTASKATAATSQTTATGAGTATSVDTDWLKGVSVSGETLMIGAATLDTQTTTQFTFSNVTVPTAASSATTVATGSVTASGTGSKVMTGLGTASTASAVTGLGTFTQPTITINTGQSTGTTIVTGISKATTTVDSADTVSAITDLGSPSTASALTGVKVTTQPAFTFTPSTKHLTASASGTAVDASGTATVIGSSATFKVTQPTVALATGATAGDGVISVATDISSASTTSSSKDTVTAITGLGDPTTAKGLVSVTYSGPSASLSSNTSSGTGRVQVLTGSSAALASAPSITVGTNDQVNAVTSVGTLSRTQDVEISVSGNGTASVLLSTTDVSINS